MPINFTFHNFEEKKPKIGESIIFLKKIRSFDSEGFEPRETTVDAVWVEYEDGEETGNCYGYGRGKAMESYVNGNDALITFELKLMFDEYFADESYFWISTKDYWKAFKDFERKVK